MPDHPPLASSAPREPMKRPRPIPRQVRAAIALMVRGRDDDPDTKPLNLVDAAKAAGVTPWVLRRYFDRPAVIALLRSERRAFTASLTAANPAALRDIRETAVNSMARVAAIRELERLDETNTHRQSVQESPFVTIKIVNVVPAPNPSSTTVIDAQVLPPPDEHRDADGRRVDERGNPVFDPFRNRIG